MSLNCSVLPKACIQDTRIRTLDIKMPYLLFQENTCQQNARSPIVPAHLYESCDGSDCPTSSDSDSSSSGSSSSSSSSLSSSSPTSSGISGGARRFNRYERDLRTPSSGRPASSISAVRARCQASTGGGQLSSSSVTLYCRLCGKDGMTE